MAYLWRRLGFEQKVAAVAAVLLILSTFGPFSLVEGAMVLTAGGVLALLRARAEGRRFHLPFGDGTVLIVAACWFALLIVVRILDRPLGQSVLALACTAVLAAAGLRERALRPADDAAPPRPAPARPAPAADPRPEPGEDVTVALPGRDADETVALPPTESPRPPRPRQGPPRPR
jgi:hypothetical protein